MTELQRLLAAYEKHSQETCALATVVKVEGSAYRRPGARMLITAEGQLTGTISGGCLEGDARRRAQQVMQRGKPEIVVYDSMDLEDDLEFGAQLGCQGKIHVLIEPLQPGADVISLLQLASRQNIPCVLSTVLTDTANIGISAGKRYLHIATATEADELADLMAEDVDDLFEQGGAATSVYILHNEPVTVFHERIDPAPALTIFGAGNDVQPVVQQAANLGWRVTVIDGRFNLTTQARFPMAEQVLCIKVEDFAVQARVKSYVLLMSHNYLYDLAALRSLIDNEDITYIGMLGPRKKADRLLDDLRAEGYDTSGIEDNLYAPVGLNIGAEAAEEIAIAVMAELIAVKNGHPAGFLKDLDGPIHQVKPNTINSD
ncbi:XdhC family protein [Mucilaginibacter sp. RS28]|uniref:XdhC family protein n=1 Tax=Mucilaginibacter straminoryzae TaxID=2932774 RepID=A0A9X1X385_9SPHI|nr:XdhC family protein [Mucilaginibacter straminoryzae]MCJ8210324.1 XdhC family protein [Mucilaginibacter straminoryzae]